MPRIIRVDETTTETDDQGQLTNTSEGGTTKERAGKTLQTAQNGATKSITKEDSGAMEVTFTLDNITLGGC